MRGLSRLTVSFEGVGVQHRPSGVGVDTTEWRAADWVRICQHALERPNLTILAQVAAYFGWSERYWIDSTRDPKNGPILALIVVPVGPCIAGGIQSTLGKVPKNHFTHSHGCVCSPLSQKNLVSNAQAKTPACIRMMPCAARAPNASPSVANARTKGYTFERTDSVISFASATQSILRCVHTTHESTYSNS
jgi:hypothetical protein